MKRCLSVFIVIVMLVGLVSVTPISAYTVKTCGDYDYSFTWDDNVSISKYKGSDSTVTIPSELDGVTVTEVSDFAFNGNTDIKEVIIPDTVTTLGIASFCDCSNLETISGGKNVTMIDGSCFSGTKWLEDQFKTSSFAVFNNMLIKVDKAKIDKDVVIPENIKSIGNDAFYKTDIESISFPEGLTVIGARAFDKCEKLKVLNLPESIEKIYYSAFSNCISLEDITIPKLYKSEPRHDWRRVRICLFIRLS